MLRRLVSVLCIVAFVAPVTVIALASPASATTFSNSTSITLNDPPDTVADAAPYPSTIAVSGLSGTISHVAVTLNNTTYAFSQDIDALLVGPGGQSLILVSDLGPNSGASAAASNSTVTFDDSGTLPTQTTPWGSSSTFKPVNFPGFNQTFGSPAPAGPYGNPGPNGGGSATLGSTFNGTSANGTWSLYVITTSAGDGTGAIAGGWGLNITTASAAATTTTLASNLNPSFTAAPNSSVTLTATVQQTSNSANVSESTVDFEDGGTTISGCGAVAVAAGQATCTTTFASEGTHPLSAAFAGDANFGPSSATLSQAVDDHTTVTGSNYCNTGSIALNNPTDTTANATPYPSHIFISGLSGTVSHLSVTLDNTTYAFAQDIDALLVGPGGQSLILTSDIGPSSGTTSLSNVSLTLDDSAASTLAQNATWGSPNASVTSKPVNYGGPNQIWGAPAPAGPYGNPGPNGGGSATLGSTFNGTSANGTWSLYVITTSAGDGTGAIAGGWCVTPTAAAVPATTTTLASSLNPSFTAAPNSSVTLTATVQQTSNSANVSESTVDFEDGGTTISGCGAVAVAAGQATCTTTFASEGTHPLSAAFAGDANFGPSSATLSQAVDDHTTVTGSNYCNTGSIALNNPTDTTANATPYPSHIFISGGTSELTHLSVSLKGTTYAFAQDIDALLVGPGGQSLILTSDIGPSSGTTSLSNVSLTLDDSAASTLAQNATWGSPNASVTSKPVNYGGPNQIWGAPAPAGPYGNPGPNGGGSATLGSTFNGTSANGTWSLYVITTSAGDGTGAIAGGWCLGATGPLAPTLATSFGAASIPLNGSTSASFTVTNPNASASLSGIGFTDTLPAGLVVSTPNGLTGSCGGGTITATAGSSTISLSGATLAGSATCTFSVNVTGTTAGTKVNTTSAVTSTEGGTGATAAATLVVAAPPTIATSFGAASIPLNGSTSASFTVTNPNASASLSGIGFTDTLPAGLVVSTPNGLTGSCGGGTITATAGSSTISLSGATLAGSATCTFSVNVTGTTAGTKVNTTSAVTSTEGGTGATAAATLVVAAPPTIATSFGAASIPLNGSTSASFTVTNPNASASLSGIGFTDTLPAGLVVSTPNGLTGSCGGGTITATAGSSTISLSGATLAGSATCTLTVDVTGASAGSQTNSVTVSSTTGGTGNTASATLDVIAPPVVATSFTPSSIPVNTTTTLGFTVTNPAVNSIPLSDVGFTDTLPAGLVVSTPNGLTGSCGGGTITATAGSGTISLSGATLASDSTCTFSVTVTASTPGLLTNTTSGATSVEGGNGPTASATLTVGGPPTIATSFGAASIPLNGSTSASFTITNPAANTSSLSGVGFTDTLPAGLVVSTPNGLTGTCGGGTITATAGSGSISLSGGTLATSSSCTFSVNVTGTAAGTQVNTTSAVTSTEGGTGDTATASLVVVAPPTIITSFGAASIPLNGSTSASFTITNPAPNTSSLSGVGFTDTLPAGLVVSTPNGLTGTCGGGTITATAGSGSISLSGGTLATSSSCTFSVNVIGTAAGTQVNTTSAVTSTEGGTGDTATASLVVAAPPTIATSFGAASIPLNGSTSASFTITNPAANTSSLSGVGFTDTLPAGLVVSTPNGLTGTCGAGTVTVTAGSGSISLSGGTLATSSSCTFSVNVTGTAAGTQVNTTSAVTSTEGGTGATATATLVVVAPPTIITAFAPTTVVVGGSSTSSFTITNPAANTSSLSGVGFTDTLPGGLVVSTPNGLTGTCGAGTITATAGSSTISLSGGTLATSSSCTFSVNVTGTAAGTQVNTTSAVTSTEGGTGGTATATLVVTKATPTIATAASGTVAVGGTVTDAATLAGGFTPTGTITFTAFAPGDTTCSGTPLATSTATVSGNGTYHSQGLTVSVAGTYRFVAAYGGDANNSPVTGACGDSNETVAVSAVVPSAPGGLAAKAGQGQIALSWTAPAFDGGVPLSGYQILRGASAGAENPVPIATVTGTSYTDSTVAPGVAYFYTVKAVNVAGVSPASNEASAKVLPVPAGGDRLAATPDGHGYWVLNDDGTVSAFGNATNYGSTVTLGIHLNHPVVGIAATPDGHGYWIVASDGGVFSFGDASFYGSTGSLTLNRPVVGVASTPDGHGYWMVASDGGVFAFGDAGFFGSLGGVHLNQPVVGIAASPDGGGYWMVASDGGIFAFGDATFHGSTGSLTLNKPMIGMTSTHSGGGYWMVASDGGVFAFGDARFFGSLGSATLAHPAIGIIPTSLSDGYTIVNSAGGATAFGAA